MDRRIFSKKTLGAILGAVPFLGSAKENKPEKPAKKPTKKPAKKPFPKYSTLPSDKADEQIRVIQTKRGYYNGHLVKSDSPVKPKGVCTSILFFADVHLVAPHLQRIRDFRNEYKNYIDDAIHLGDTVGGCNTGTFTMWDDFPTAMNVIGNHDVYSNQKNKSKKYSVKENWLTDREKYDFYFKKYIPSWNVVQPENAEAEGKCYWYKDYNNDLRVIGIDCMQPEDSKQIEWFKATLEDAKAKGLKVVIATHIPPICDKKIDCAFTSIDYTDKKPPYYGTKNLKEFVKAIDEFIVQGGVFASWVCGHAHHDMILYAQAKQKQLVIIIECATDWPNWTDANHIAGTSTASAWELIGVESITNVIKIARFGNNFDHQMRHKGTFCYDFVNHKLITVS